MIRCDLEESLERIFEFVKFILGELDLREPKKKTNKLDSKEFTLLIDIFSSPLYPDSCSVNTSLNKNYILNNLF